MAALNFAELERPVSVDEPCGPDLDLQGDSDFLQLVARTESVLPSSFFERNDAGGFDTFDRADIDFASEYAAITALLKRTRDLRLLTYAGRLLALDRNLGDCIRCLSAIVALLRDQWDGVHPRGEDGDYGYRFVVLQVLDDMPTMILPLQHLPLLSHRRFGPISYRTMQVATAAVAPRPGEKALDRAELERALRDADPEDLATAQANAERLLEIAEAIASISAEHVGPQNSVRLDRLVDLARGILRILEETAGSRAPIAPLPAAIAPATGDGAVVPSIPTATAGSITNRAAVTAALAAVSSYFQNAERSSPAALLVRQAERLVGLPFHETLRALLPNHAEEASLYIGPKPGASFQLRIERIAELIGDAEESPEPDLASVAPIEVTSRAAAVAVLREISAYYRVSEPSSPIPLFTDRACGLVNQDFLSILTDVLPGIRLGRDTD